MTRILAGLALAFLATAALAQDAEELEKRGVVQFGSGHANVTRWQVEIAETSEEQRIGLMNRPSLPVGHGMLFDFGETRPVAMWMRNTLIPLDMVFVCPDGTVARVARAEPLDETIVPSGEPVRYVLEVNAGEATGAGLARGKRLNFEGGGRLDGPRSGCGR